MEKSSFKRLSIIGRLPPDAESVLYRVRAEDGSEYCLKTVRRWHHSEAEHAPLREQEGRNSPYYRKKRQLVNEYQIGRALQHQKNNAAPCPFVHDIRHHRFCGFEWGCELLLDYIPGSDLSRLVNRKTLQDATLLNILFQTAHTLSYLHKRRYIHLDIKSSNLILKDQGIKVVDLGIAKITGTVPGAVTGTPGYMAPEQVKADSPVDERTDIYALGVVANVLFGGQPLPQEEIAHMPSRLRKTMASAAMQQQETFLHLLHFRHRSPVLHGMEDLVARCTAPDPRWRPGKMEQVIGEIGRIAERNGIQLEDSTL